MEWVCRAPSLGGAVSSGDGVALCDVFPGSDEFGVSAGVAGVASW